MRKIMGILMAAVMVLATAATTAITTAKAVAVSPKLSMEKNSGNIGYLGYLTDKQGQKKISINEEIHLRQLKEQREQKRIHHPASLKIRFRGKWGFAGDNKSDGYVAGVITKIKRFVLLKGIWNESNSTEKGKIAGVLKRGYFAGRVIKENGNGTHRIAGIYKIDREHRLLKMRWITPYSSGWTIIKIVEIERDGR